APLNIGDRATWNVNADGGMGSGTVNVADLGRLSINNAQTSLPTINVGALGVLSGTVKNLGGTNLANYSATGGGNVNLVENAILALDAGETEPTEADLGLTPGVKDAILWKGATTTGTTSAGDDGNSVYKGVAVGQFTPNRDSSSNTYTTPVGDLAVAMVHNATGTSARYTGAKFDSPTGVANIDMFGTSAITLRQSLKGTANEFHFRNKGNVARTLVTFDLDAVTAAQQVHAYDGGVSIGSGATPDIKGRLELHGDSMMTLHSQQIVPDTNTVIVLNDNTALSVNTGEEAALEQLTLGTDLIVNSTGPHVYLENRSGGYDFTGAVSGTPNANMLAILKMSDVSLEGNNNNVFALNEDLTLGDGKYIIQPGSSHKGMQLGDGVGIGKIVADTGATSIGLADLGSPDAGSGLLKINTIVDGNGTATVRIGSATELTGVRPSNQRVTQVPSGTVQLEANASFVNTPEVAVESGTLKLTAPMTFPEDLTVNATLNTSGNGVTVNGLLGGAGQITGNGTVNVLGGVAPGVGIGALDAGNLSLAAGGGFELEIADPDDVGGAKGTGAGTGWDYLMTDTLALGGDWSITLANAGLTRNIVAADEFLIATSGDGFAGITSLPTYNAPQGWTTSGATLDIVGNDLFLSGITGSSSAAVPEPSTFLLAALGLLGLAMAGRRRRTR
ncbi:MAG: PEP-CTERM sorting domain-containing protein, partial [Planctomycetes bacterium]|nr:PEP-CTERM sorting domain-containing protein [Planctomycetota bacterium]